MLALAGFVDACGPGPEETPWPAIQSTGDGDCHNSACFKFRSGDCFAGRRRFCFSTLKSYLQALAIDQPLLEITPT